MTFKVTCRGKDGALREETVEASGRAECMVECKRRGILPVSVKEGALNGHGQDGGSPRGRTGSRPSHSSSGKPQSSIINFKSSIFLVAAVLAVAGGIWWWFTSNGGQGAVATKTPKRVAEASSQKPACKPVPKATNEAARVVAPISNAAPPEAEEPFPVHVPKYTNIAYRTSARGVLSVHGKPVQPHRRLFKHVSERAIQKLLLVKPGGKVIGNPIPRNFDENFRESLKEEITFEPEDTPADIEMKKSMIAVKKELADRMAKGESPSQVLKEEIAELRRLAKYRSNLQKQVNELKRDGSEQDAADLKAAANRMLEENGLKPLPGAKIKAE